MTELMNIINTKVVIHDWDVFWKSSPFLAGMQEKPVLILSASYPDGSAEEIQLHRMLDACQLTAAHYNIIRVPDTTQISWHQLRDELKPRVVLLIGLNPSQAGISALLKINEPNHFNDCIWIPTLSIMNWNKFPEVKKQLWESLQSVFIHKNFGNI